MVQGPWTCWDESSGQSVYRKDSNVAPLYLPLMLGPISERRIMVPVPRGGDFDDRDWDGKPRWIAAEAPIQDIPGD